MKKNKRRLNIFLILLFALAVLDGAAIFLKDETAMISTASFSDTEQPLPDSLTSTQQDLTEDRRLILVNKDHTIPQNYELELFQLTNGVYVDSRIYPDLQQMFDDARNDGIYPTVSEGYRTHDEQQKMMDDKINSFVLQGYSEDTAESLAKEWVAEPGKSEHELGLALDINADENGFSSDREVYDWLSENAYRYGFILRYPQGKEHITGIDHEPWHYRYVGKEYAQEIYTQQITLEEYLE